MATVRISKSLIDAVSSKALLTMAPALERAQQDVPDSSWGVRIYDILFGDVQSVLAQLPSNWLRFTDEFTVTGVGGVNCKLLYRLPVARPWPNIVARTDLVEGTYSIDRVVLTSSIVWGEYHAEVVRYHNRIDAARSRQDGFVGMVKQILTAYSTLAPALKAWPPLWDLLPEDVKEKHREVYVAEKRVVNLNVDVDKLTAMSTAAKLGI